MTLQTPELAAERESDEAAALPHSRPAVASFYLALLGAIIPAHLIILLLLGFGVSHGYAVTSVFISAGCCLLGIVLAAVSLFDRRKNRVLGLTGWWLGIVACGFLSLSLRLAIRHHVLRR